MLSLQFRYRLTHHVNNAYLKGVNFYKAVNLGGDSRIDNAYVLFRIQDNFLVTKE